MVRTPERVDVAIEGAEEPILVPDGVLLGYCRVSTPEQSLEAQRRALWEAGCYEVYGDMGKSGATMKRPELEACLRALQPGNTLVVWKLDRLGRSVRDLTALLDELKQRKVGFRSLTEGVDTSTIAGNMMFTMIASIAEMERELIRERTRAGLAVAAGRGGRPRRLQDHDVVEARRLRHSERWKVDAIAAKFKVSRSTIIRAIRADGSDPVGYGGDDTQSHNQEPTGGQSAQKKRSGRAGKP